MKIYLYIRCLSHILSDLILKRIPMHKIRKRLNISVLKFV